ncbi:MAG TPA: hypothetical protein ENJ44_04080, partial [Oceanospirillales bacterium]|nr:hypothetical protein [Oceanospirillales bacterium]
MKKKLLVLALASLAATAINAQEQEDFVKISDGYYAKISADNVLTEIATSREGAIALEKEKTLMDKEFITMKASTSKSENKASATTIANGSTLSDVACYTGPLALTQGFDISIDNNVFKVRGNAAYGNK